MITGEGAAAVIAAAALLHVPGAVLARAAGVRRGWSLVLAPALTWGVIGAGTVAVPAAGARWHPATVLAWWAVLVAFAVAARLAGAQLRWAAGRRARWTGAGPSAGATVRRAMSVRAGRAGEGSRGGVAVAVGGVVAAAAVVAQLARGAGVGLGGVDQLWDAVWHANLTAWIARTGVVSPTGAPSQLFGAGWRVAPSTYPDALHATGALVADLTGAPPLTSLAAVVAVSFALVLPAGAAALTWTLTRGSGVGAALAAVLSVASVAFPTDQWWRGVWAYGVCLAATPAACALVVAGLRGQLHPDRSPAVRAGSGRGSVPSVVVAVRRWVGGSLVPTVPLAVLAVAGLTALQPAAAVLAALLLGAWALGQLARRRWPGALAAAAATALLLWRLPDLVWSVVERSPTLASLASYDYATVASARAALGQVLGLVTPVDPALGYGLPAQAPQRGLEVVLLVSLALVATSREHLWLAAVEVLLVAAAVACTAPVSAPFDQLHALTLFFYSSGYRLVAVVAVVGAVTAGVALARAARWVPRGSCAGRGVALVALLAGVVALAVAVDGTFARGEVRLRAGYAPRVVGPDQRRVMDALAARIQRSPAPRGSRVLNDSVDGSPWLYALTGVEPMFTHYSTGQVPDSLRSLLAHLDQVDTDAQVREELRVWRVCYVYANDTLVTGRRTRAGGFAHLGSARDLHLVAKAGGAAAYRVDVPGLDCTPPKAVSRSVAGR